MCYPVVPGLDRELFYDPRGCHPRQVHIMLKINNLGVEDNKREERVKVICMLDARRLTKKYCMHDVHSLGSLLAARRIVSRLDLAFAETLLVCAGLKDISNFSN